MFPRILHDEERIAALRRLRLLDTPPQPTFDRITRLCAEMFGCSFSLISLVDEMRQWFLSAHGIELSETGREASLCHHAIAAEGCLHVPDTREDSRFAANPLVVGKPGIRSYLGCPIRSPDGFLLGALCVADKRPREFDQSARLRLELAAATVEDLIKAHVESVTAARLNKLLWRDGRRIKKAHHLLKQAEKIGRIGAWELNLERQSMSFSDEMYALASIPKGTPIDTQRALQFYNQRDHDRVNTAIRRAAEEGVSFDYEADLLTGDGGTKRIRCTGERLDGHGNRSARVVGVIQDISDAYHANLALKRAADYDSLTGVYNRHAFDRGLQEKIREHRRGGESLYLILIDLDGFKDINDSFGHVMGDVILEEVSSLILNATPPDALLARWGGDEFAMIPPLGTSFADVSDLAGSVTAAIAKMIEISGCKIHLSGTCGIARFENGMGTKELVRRADLALYHGKKRERGAVHHYAAEMESTNIARQLAVAEVRAALDENRVFAAYQPIVRLADSRVIGMEALLRLNTRSGGKLTATEVLPALIDPMLSREIAARMLTFLCCDLGHLQAAQPDLQFVAVNVTEADLLSRDFASKFLSSLAEASLDPRKVTLEITETMLLVNDNATVLKALTELHSAGVRIALDDFGTGFSSLAHLRDFPIDKVKIDSSFIQTMEADVQARTIVQALIAMAKNMGIAVVAEGVETDTQLNLLRQMGCELAQGFYFSPALDIGSASLATFRNSSTGGLVGIAA